MPTTAEPILKASIENSETIETAVTVKPKTCASELISYLNLLQVARGHNDRRLVSRVLQHLPQIRRQLNANILISLLQNPSISGMILLSDFTNLY
jgi:hypothetical protein